MELTEFRQHAAELEDANSAILPAVKLLAFSNESDELLTEILQEADTAMLWLLSEEAIRVRNDWLIVQICSVAMQRYCRLRVQEHADCSFAEKKALQEEAQNIGHILELPRQLRNLARTATQALDN
jgi:hypothetical protein